MKRYIILFAIFITAIFFYPVFAHADKIGCYFAKNPVSESAALFLLGLTLVFAAGFTKNTVPGKADKNR